MTQTTLQCGQEHELYNNIKNLFHACGSRMHDNRFGPKVYTNLQRIALLILRVRSGYSYERFCDEYLPESRWPRWLGLRDLPGSSTLHRWAQEFDMQFIRDLNDKLLEDEDPETLAIDGTGIDSWRRSRHYERRLGEAPRQYAKADIIVDTDSLLVHDWSLLLRKRHDSHVAKQLLSRTTLSGVLIIGDKGYDAEELYEICYWQDNRFFAPVRDAPNKGAPPDTLPWYKRKSHRIKTDYHRRSLVESTIRSLKSRISALTARIHYMKKREFGWHVLVRNLELKINLLLRILRMLEMLANQHQAVIWDEAGLINEIKKN